MKVYQCFVAAMMAGYVSAISTGIGKEVVAGYNVNAVYDAKNEQVVYTFVVPNNSWMGILLGTNIMRKADGIVISANG